MDRPEDSVVEDMKQMGRGLCMGAADIVPGVSGGTVALILGIYERLVTAISRVDLELISEVRGGRFADAGRHLDIRFLLALGLGIGAGVVGLAGPMHYLLEHEMATTFGAFFGLILASTLIVARLIEDWKPMTILAAMAGAVFAYWLTGQVPVVAQPSALYIFFCGMVAICAMILPGISGSFILLIFGMYFHVTGVLKGFAHGEITAEGLMTVAAFGAGAVIGIISFSKILRVLLERAQSLTMAVLCGFMFGSLRRIWPFKVEDTATLAKEFKEKVFFNVWPWESGGPVLLPIVFLVLGFALVQLLDRFSVDA
jgi:putative membrane protein